MLSRRHQGNIASKIAHRNQSVGYRFQAETLLFWESGRHTVAVWSQDCSNTMAPMRGGSGLAGTNSAVAKNRSEDHRKDGSISRRPIAAGRSGGRGTDPRMLPVAEVAGAEPTMVALALPTMVNPTWICPVLSRANATDEGSMQRTKTNRHIFLAPGRDRKSGFATMLCRDGAVFAHHLI
jgi:hypothetical protein